MDERYRFVSLAIQPGANVSALCRQFGISRKTGYKLLQRYRQEGRAGVTERSRRPHTVPHEVSTEMVCEIVSVRNAHPRWGGATIRAVLLRDYKSEVVPCGRTIDRVLEKCGLVQRRRRRGKKIYIPEQVIQPKKPNDVWTVDFKGWWLTGDGKRCMPLTIRDAYSRYILDIGALTHGTTTAVKKRFEACFERFGTPLYIRSDNGSPFCASEALQGLSELSVWWIKLGILPNRIPPASPAYNGGHERMHLDMKAELQKTPARNARQQQRVFDVWRGEFNSVRPHHALKMKTPYECYECSERSYQQALQHQFHYDETWETRKVTARGEVWWEGTRHFIAGALAREHIGIAPEDKGYSLWFRNFSLGTTDEHFTKVTPASRGRVQN